MQLLSLPQPLRPGDRVRPVAASSALEEPGRLEAGLALLEAWGLLVDPRPELPSRRWGYLAGSDAERAADLGSPAALHACVRGGWGAARLLE
ncbi:MAG: LD-carboxypeptidase, partial [Cyanobium sp.]